MSIRRVVSSGLVCTFLGLFAAGAAHAQSGRIYNTVKQKLAAGKQVVGTTISSSDRDSYCAAANAGFDFTWIEMQHSPLTYQEVADMLWACKDAEAIPFIRVPDATEGDIQKATDLGALGIIVPMVDDVQKIKDAVTYAKFPPKGKRSQGGGQHRSLWGNDYRETANENIMIVAMIESPAGVAIVDQIAAVDGVDVIFAASTDLSSFSGWKQGDAKYEEMITKIHDATVKAGVTLAGPVAWKGQSERPDFAFFQGPGPSRLIRAGAEVMLKGEGSSRPRSGVAPTEGSEPRD